MSLVLQAALLCLSFAVQDPAPEIFECLGTTRAARSATLSAPLGLELVECMTPGTVVEQGQVIASFANASEALARQQATIELSLKQNSLKQRELNYRRQSELLELLRNQFDVLRALNAEGRSSMLEVQAVEIRTHEVESTVLTLENAIEEARLHVAHAEAALEMADLKLRATQIHAPFSGVIAAVHLNVGERSRETPVIDVHDPSRLLLECPIPTRASSLVKRIGSGRVFPDSSAESKKGPSIEGRFKYITHTLHGEDKNATLWLDLGEVQAGYQPGQQCYVIFTSR